MPQTILTVRDLEGLADGDEITVPHGALITPLATEEAGRRGIRLHFADAPQSPPRAGEAARSVAIGADHGGYELKEYLRQRLREWGYMVLDCGTDSTAAVDYPDIAEAVATGVASGQAWRGVVIDTVGVGSAMAANKVPGVRAAPCYDRGSASSSREHNDANVLALGARNLAPEQAREILAVWLATPFAGGRHARRVEKICAIEQRHAQQPKSGTE